MSKLKKIIGIGVFAGCLWGANSLFDESVKERFVASDYHHQFLNAKDAVEIRDSKLGCDSAKRNYHYYELGALASVVAGFYGLASVKTKDS